MADQSIADALRSIGTDLHGLLVKFFPALAGSLLSLRFLPAGATFTDRLIGAVGGLVSSIELAPILIEFAGISSPKMMAGAEFLTGLFAISVFGELSASIRAVGLPEILRDWVRRLLRLPPVETKTPPPEQDKEQ